VLLATLLLGPPAAQAQVPGAPAQGQPQDDAPKIKIAGDLNQLLEDERKSILRQQQQLLLEASEEQTLRQRLSEIRKRIIAVKRLKVEVTAAAARKPAPDPKPAPTPEPKPAPPPTPDAGSTADAGATDATGSAEATSTSSDASASSDAPSKDASAGPDAGTDAAQAPAPKPVAPKPKAPPKPRVADASTVHPAQLLEVERLLKALEALEKAVDATLLLHSGERVLLSDSLALIDRTLKRIDEAQRAAKNESKKWGLREVEQLALKTHLARIQLSLARARERQSTDDAQGDANVAAVLTPLAKLPTMMPLDDPSETNPQVKSYRVAESLRAETLTLRREIDSKRQAYLTRSERVTQRRGRFVRLDRMSAEQDLSSREELLAQALDQIFVKEDEIARLEKRLEKSKKLRQAARSKLQKQLDQARSQQTGGAGSASDDRPFTASRARAVRMEMLAEKLTLEAWKLERDLLYRDLAVSVNGMLDGIHPGEDFTSTHAKLLDSEGLQKREEDLESRCEGWRRARNVAQRKEPPPEYQSYKDKLMASYAGLLDTCMREDFVLGTQKRLAEIGSYHLRRVEREAAGWRWWLPRSLLTLLFAGLALFATVILGRITLRYVRRRRREDEDAGVDVSDRRIGRLYRAGALVIYVTGSIALILAGIFLIFGVAWDSPLDFGAATGWLTHPLFLVGEAEVSAWTLLRVILWLIVTVWAARVFSRFLADNFLQYFALDRGVRDAIGTFARYTILLVGFILAISSAGIPVGALTVLFGTIGIVVGFGLQSIVTNFISGFIILIERPIRNGDFVETENLKGTVTHISARSTTIETRDSVSVIIPNSQFASEPVMNFTHRKSESVRTQVEIGVSYASDLDNVERLLLDVGNTHPDVLSEPAPWVELEKFGESSVQFRLHIWTRRIRSLPRLVSDLNKQVWKIFGEHGIQIPFPQREITLKGPGLALPEAHTPTHGSPSDADPESDGA